MKKTYKDYKPQLYKLELVDPFEVELIRDDEGQVIEEKPKKNGAWIMLNSANNLQFRQQIWRIDRMKANMDPEELAEKLNEYSFLLEENATLVSTRIVDWDEEFFEEKFSKEAAKKMLLDEDCQWIVAQINKANDDESNFFYQPKKPRKVSKGKRKVKQNKS